MKITTKLLTNTKNRRNYNHKDTTTTTTTNDDGGSGSSSTRIRKKIYGIILPKKVCSYILNTLRRNKSSSSSSSASEGEERICSNTCYENNEGAVDARDDSPNLEEVFHADKGSSLLMVEGDNQNHQKGRSKLMSFINTTRKQQQTDDDNDDDDDDDDDDDENKNTDHPQLIKNVVSDPAAAPACKTDEQTPILQEEVQLIFPFSGILSKAAGSRKLGRVSSMRLINSFCRRSELSTTTREKTSNQEPEAEAEAEEEYLCKKRILMGGKCRPLNVSGSLHYDCEGILVPEEILPSED